MRPMKVKQNGRSFPGGNEDDAIAEESQLKVLLEVDLLRTVWNYRACSILPLCSHDSFLHYHTKVLVVAKRTTSRASSWLRNCRLYAIYVPSIFAVAGLFF